MKLPNFSKVLGVVASRPRGLRNGKAYPADLGGVLGKKAGNCAVQLWAKLHDLPSKDSNDVGGWLKFRAGDAFHNEIQGALISDEMSQTGWVVIGVEQWVENRGMRGKVDLVLLHMETGQRLVVDIKTKDSSWFRYAKTRAGDVLQVQYYMEAIGAEWGMILYIDREGKFDPIQREVERADERVERGVARIEELTAAQTVEELPEWVEFCTGMDWQLKYCNLDQCLCAQAQEGGSDEQPF